MQDVYNSVCKLQNYNENTNFLYPAIKPDAALIGWNKNHHSHIWPRHGSMKAEADQVIRKMIENKMIRNASIKKVTFDYKIVSEWTHVAEIIVEFSACTNYVSIKIHNTTGIILKPILEPQRIA